MTEIHDKVCNVYRKMVFEVFGINHLLKGVQPSDHTSTFVEDVQKVMGTIVCLSLFL